MSDSAPAMATLRERLRRDRAAFLFIDLQNDFSSAKGKMAEFGFDLGLVRESVGPTRRASTPRPGTRSGGRRR
jgi:hypothetical protein